MLPGEVHCRCGRTRTMRKVMTTVSPLCFHITDACRPQLRCDAGSVLKVCDPHGICHCDLSRLDEVWTRHSAICQETPRWSTLVYSWPARRRSCYRHESQLSRPFTESSPRRCKDALVLCQIAESAKSRVLLLAPARLDRPKVAIALNLVQHLIFPAV
jgi:hypothetical protein